MTKRTHPAEAARKFVGVASGVALVGIVTGFQFSANAQEANQAQSVATSTPAAVAPVTPTGETAAVVTAPEAVPAPGTAPAVQQVAVPDQAAPAAPVEVQAPAAVAPAAPAPVAPAAPVNGTTAGSGG